MIDPAVKALCDEFDLEIVARNVKPLPGQTRAVHTIERILKKRGEEHTRMVLSCLMETRENDGLIDEVSLWAVSDLMLACREWIDRHMSDWLDAFDALPMGKMLYIINELRGTTHQRHALAGLVYFYLRGLVDPEHTLAKPVVPQEERGIIPPICRQAA